jgi:LmbE family N-acetylglucosaminyl deacetylase
MITFDLLNRAPRVLCLGCHPDDIEIGCGGTIQRLVRERPDCVFHWVVFSATGARVDEARLGVARLVDPERLNGLMLATFSDGFMPFEGAEVKTTFESIRRSFAPDLILTHSRADAHQDHRLIGELTWNTFRDHLILEYEIPKYDGDMGRPGVFVPLPVDMCETKVRILMDTFRSQCGKRWFSPDTFFSLMRLRGMECNAPSGFAEAFYCRKLVI